MYIYAGREWVYFWGNGNAKMTYSDSTECLSYSVCDAAEDAS